MYVGDGGVTFRVFVPLDFLILMKRLTLVVLLSLSSNHKTNVGEVFNH